MMDLIPMIGEIQQWDLHMERHQILWAICLSKISNHLLNHLGLTYPWEVVVNFLGEEDLSKVVVNLPKEKLYLQDDLGQDLFGTHGIHHGIWYLLLLPQVSFLQESHYLTPSTFFVLTLMFMLKSLGKLFKLMERKMIDM